MHIKIKSRICNYFNNLIESEKLKNKNILVDEKNFKNLVIYFTRYVNCNSIKMLSLYFYKSLGRIEKRDGKNI